MQWLSAAIWIAHALHVPVCAHAGMFGTDLPPQRAVAWVEAGVGLKVAEHVRLLMEHRNWAVHPSGACGG